MIIRNVQNRVAPDQSIVFEVTSFDLTSLYTDRAHETTTSMPSPACGRTTTFAQMRSDPYDFARD